MQIACHLIDGPWLRVFYALPTLIFSVFTGEFRFNEAVNIMRSQKLVILSHSRSFRQTWSYSAWMTVYTCISFHAIMLLGSYAKDYTGIWVLSIIYLFVYSHCSFPSCAKKLIKTEPKWFYWYSDATVLQSRQFQIIQENFNYLSKRTCI